MLLTTVVLPTPGPPVMTVDLAVDRGGHRGALGVREGQPGAALHPGDGLARCRWRPRPAAAAAEPADAGGDALLGALQRGQEEGRAVVDRLRHQVLLLASSARDRLLDDGRRDLQQRRRPARPGPRGRRRSGRGRRSPGGTWRTPAWARIRESGAMPEPLGDGVRGLEADAVDVEGQPVGVLGDPGDGLVPIGLVDAHRPRGADPVGLEEDHDLADHLLLGPGPGDPLLALGADAGEFEQLAPGCPRSRRRPARRRRAPACGRSGGRCP